MTSSTAELSVRFARVRGGERAKAKPPEHAIAFTVIAVALAYAMLFLPIGPVDYREASFAAVLSAALLGLALCWSVFPRLATIGIPFGYIALAALLREAGGGSSSGFGGLYLLPVLWLAVTAGRRELGVILMTMATAQIVPLAFVGEPEYPKSGWRGAMVLMTVATITGLMVQRLVDQARRRAELLQEQTDSLTHASAQLARQNERLLELDRLKDAFIATASHELRTPLTSISGYLDMSLDPAEGPLPATVENHLRIVQRNAGRLTLLVDQLMFLARVDSQRLEVDRAPVDLGEILREASETALPAAHARNIDIAVEVEQSNRVLADRLQLLRLVDNLVTNAIKFTPEGGNVCLTATANGDSATLEVRDDGAGIPISDRAELFTRFFRGTNAVEKAIPGSGLGLAISQVIAEAHGTTIQVESTAGVGSIFRVALPLARN